MSFSNDINACLLDDLTSWLVERLGMPVQSWPSNFMSTETDLPQTIRRDVPNLDQSSRRTFPLLEELLAKFIAFDRVLQPTDIPEIGKPAQGFPFTLHAL